RIAPDSFRHFLPSLRFRDKKGLLTAPACFARVCKDYALRDLVHALQKNRESAKSPRSASPAVSAPCSAGSFRLSSRRTLSRSRGCPSADRRERQSRQPPCPFRACRSGRRGRGDRPPRARRTAAPPPEASRDRPSGETPA